MSIRKHRKPISTKKEVEKEKKPITISVPVPVPDHIPKSVKEEKTIVKKEEIVVPKKDEIVPPDEKRKYAGIGLVGVHPDMLIFRGMVKMKGKMIGKEIINALHVWIETNKTML